MRNSRTHFLFSSLGKIIFLTLPLFLLILISIFSVVFYIFYYSPIQSRWLNDKGGIIKKLNGTYHGIEKEIYPDRDKQFYLKSTQPDLESNGLNKITIIYDINKKIIGKLSKEVRSDVGLNNVSTHFINALLATEDREFHSHNGINYKAILRAMVRNIMAMRLHQGGSTLTQQLAKILFTKRERTLERKIYEMFIAQEIEELYDKNAILLMYVNKVHFGHNIDGIREASLFYFNKEAKYLTIAESALLAGIISNPSAFSPYKHPVNAKARHLRVLKGMSDANYIKKDSYKKIHRKFWANYNFKKRRDESKKYIEKKNLSPYVMAEVKKFFIDKLSKKPGYNVKTATEKLYTGGWRIYTSIDLDLQKIAERTLRKGIYDYRKQAKKIRSLKHHLYGIQGALVAIDPKTGYIKAFVGGYRFEKTNQFNRAFQAKRQPGSAFKPILYLAALDKRDVSPYSLRYDGFRPIELKGGKQWNVRNYGNRYYNREITLTQALKVSSNQVAAQLISEVGVRRVREIIKISLDLEDDLANKLYPNGRYAIALGAVGMTPLELAEVYSMMANQGLRVRARLILKIENSTGTERIFDDQYSEEEYRQKVRVVSKESAYQITEMMRQVLSPGGTGYSIRRKVKNIDFDIVGKTGTSQKYRDLWFAGYNPELCTVVWIGHDKNLSLSGGGGKIAGPIFGHFMKEASKALKFSRFKEAQSYNFTVETVCRDSGKIATDECVNIDSQAVFSVGTEPAEYCNMNHNNKNTSVKKYLEKIDYEEGDFNDQVIETLSEREERLRQKKDVEQLNDLSDKKVRYIPKKKTKPILIKTPIRKKYPHDDSQEGNNPKQPGQLNPKNSQKKQIQNLKHKSDKKDSQAIPSKKKQNPGNKKGKTKNLDFKNSTAGKIKPKNQIENQP